MQPLATIPSPAQGVWHLGPFPVRAYALMIILGIVVAVWLGERRWAARGGTPGAVIDVAVWAVPFGLIGGRLYHVLTDWQRYFGDGGDPVRALQIWEGGLGIWGAVVLGGVGAWIGCRRRGISVLALGDAIAPGVALAQGIGRWGNWWNQELYGRPLDAWWALEIDPDHRPKLEGTGAIDPRYADVATYHPTFLYESLWCVALAFVVIWAGRRYRLTHGRTFALYVAGYTLGRFWIEWLRIDEAHVIAGLRLNDWTSLIVFAGAVAYLWAARHRTSPEPVTVKDATVPAVAADGPEAKPAPEPAVAAEPVAEAPPEPADEPPAGIEDAPETVAEPEPVVVDEPEPEAETRAEAVAEPEPVVADEPGPEPAVVDGPEPRTTVVEEPEREAADEPEPGREPVAVDEPGREPEVAAVDGPESLPEPGVADDPEPEPEPGVADEPESEAEPVAVDEPEGVAPGRETAETGADADGADDDDGGQDEGETAGRAAEPVKDSR